jgi:hypothetical protein
VFAIQHQWYSYGSSKHDKECPSNGPLSIAHDVAAFPSAAKARKQVSSKGNGSLGGIMVKVEKQGYFSQT